jgi:hypothetical protein
MGTVARSIYKDGVALTSKIWIFCRDTIVVYIYQFPYTHFAGLPFGGNTNSTSVMFQQYKKEEM